jgi:hypothetical protein
MRSLSAAALRCNERYGDDSQKSSGAHHNSFPKFPSPQRGKGESAMRPFRCDSWDKTMICKGGITELKSGEGPRLERATEIRALSSMTANPA